LGLLGLLGLLGMLLVPGARCLRVAVVVRVRLIPCTLRVLLSCLQRAAGWGQQGTQGWQAVVGASTGQTWGH
jgi:hypothetical protein